MKAWIASILLVAVCTLTPAFAQDGAAAPNAPAPNQAQIDAAIDLLKASNTAANMQAVVETLLPIQAAQLRREHPDASDETIKGLLKVIDGILLSHVDDLIQLYAIAYSRRFSIEEMHTLSAFYRSETGQKYLKELPSLMKEMTPMVVGYLDQIVRRELESVIAKKRAQGEKI